jgi:hypothetical protein
MASSGARAEIYFGPPDCTEASMPEEPGAPAIAELYRQAAQKAERQKLNG